MKLNVATYNIWGAKDFSTEEHKVNTKNVAKFIADQKIDVCGLNEVDVHSKRTDYVHEPEAICADLKEMTGETYYWVMGVGLDSYHNPGAQYGNALISKYPVVKYETYPIFADYVVDPENPKSQIQERRERRVLIVAELDLGEGKTMTAFITHFDLYLNTMQSAVDTIKGLLPEVKTPILLAGDFNVTEDSDIAAQLDALLERTGKDDPSATFRSGVKIDYIYHSTDIKCLAYRTHHDYKTSDHFPVSAVFEL